MLSSMAKSFGIPILFFLLLIINSAKVQAQYSQLPHTAHYNNGIDLFEKGLYESAANEFELFIRQNENHQLNASAHFYLARSQAEFDSAHTAAYYEAFVTEFPRTAFSSRLLFELAQKSEQQQQFKRAADYYRRAISYGLNKEQSARAYYWMAEAEVAAGNKEQAREHFLALANKHPESEWAPKALYARGRLFLSENRYESATVAFEILKERYPNDEMTRRIGTALGESYYQQGKYNKAIEALRNAIPYLNEELTSKAVYLIAESYNYLNNFDEASAHYLRYINLNKGTDKVRVAHYGLGWVYHKQQIYHWAAEEFGKAAKGTDELARKALYYKAVNEKLGSRYAEAMETFRTFGERFKEGLWVEEAYYEWAITAYEMGIYSEAIQVLLPLVRDEKNLDWKGKVYTLLGEAYFANGEYTRAIQAFEAAEKVTDVDPAVQRQARFQKAWVQYNNQAYEQAQPVFESLNEQYPETELGSEALFWSADAYYHMEDYGPAGAQFEQFIQRYPNHELVGPANYSLGWSHFKMGNYQEAIEPFKTFLEDYEPPEIALYPYDTDTKLRIGDSYYAIGDYANAITYYSKAIGAEPGGDYAMFQIANSHYRSENNYEAVTTFRKFLRIYPYSRLREQAQYNIAYIYLNAGNYSQAVEEFKTVINKYPNTPWAARSQYNIGDTYYNAGEYEQAIAAYRKVMEEYPQSEYILEAVNGIQYAQLSSGKADSSSGVLEEYLANNPNTSMADRLRFRQAANLMQSGNYQRAIDEFHQYIRITNNQQLLPEAHFNLATAYEQVNDLQAATNQFQTIVNTYPNSERVAPALAALGRITFQQGSYQASYEYFNRLLQQDSQYLLEAYIGMGNAQLAMNNITLAEQQYGKALEKNSDYDPAQVGLARVALKHNDHQKAEQLLAPVAETNTTEVGAEAQYLLGVTYQQQGEYRSSVDAFSKVNVLYGAYNEWVAKAMLGQAKSYIQLGMRGEARSMLNDLIESFPGTAPAQEAERLLN